MFAQSSVVPTTVRSYWRIGIGVVDTSSDSLVHFTLGVSISELILPLARISGFAQLGHLRPKLRIVHEKSPFRKVTFLLRRDPIHV